MTHVHRPRHEVEPARSFDLVADAYDRARPSYPLEAAQWILEPPGPGTPGAWTGKPTVLELGAGTGKLTERLVGLGCTTTASDPSESMLTRLGTRVPAARRVAGSAEQIPLGSRSVDVVVAAQSFHWFDPARALPEIARVLRPRGRLALVWNARDERVPWVRRLGRIIEGRPHQDDDPVGAIDASGLFAAVERTTFRFWQPLTAELLSDLVVSRSVVALMSDRERQRVLHEVDALYAEYGRGSDGMLLPYITTVYRTEVLPWARTDDPTFEEWQDRKGEQAGQSTPPGRSGDDPDSLLIDFR